MCIVCVRFGYFAPQIDSDKANQLDHFYYHHLLCHTELSVDASYARNGAALINDCRGRSPPVDPNVRIIEVYVDGCPILVVDNTKAIKKGEQLLGEFDWYEGLAGATVRRIHQ